MDTKSKLSNSVETNIALLVNDMTYVKNEVADIKKILGDKYVTIEMFEPVRRIVYGLVGLVLSSVVAGVLALILKG